MDQLLEFQREFRWALRMRGDSLASDFMRALAECVRFSQDMHVVRDVARAVRERMEDTLRISVLGRKEAEAHEFSGNTLVLSIVNHGPQTRDAELRPGATRVERFRFHDLDPAGSESYGEPLPPSVIRACMRIEDGMRVIKAVEEWLGAGEKDVLVHCEEGMSRSAGVAAALAHIYNGNDTHWYRTKLPNSHVRHCVMYAWSDFVGWTMQDEIKGGLQSW